MQTISSKKTLQFTRQLQHQLSPSGLSLNKRQSRRMSDDIECTPKISFSDSKTTKQDDDDIVYQIQYDDRLLEERRFDTLYLIENECESRSYSSASDDV